MIPPHGFTTRPGLVFRSVSGTMSWENFTSIGMAPCSVSSTVWKIETASRAVNRVVSCIESKEDETELLLISSQVDDSRNGVDELRGRPREFAERVSSVLSVGVGDAFDRS